MSTEKDKQQDSSEKHQSSLESLMHRISNGQEKWQKGWKAGEIQLPFNASTQKEYTGGNLAFFSQEDRNAGFLTFNQIKKLGLSLKEGARGRTGFRVLTFDDKFLKEKGSAAEEAKEKGSAAEEAKEKGSAAEEAKGKGKDKFFGLTTFTVFSCADVYGPGSEKLARSISDTQPAFNDFLREIKKSGLEIKEQSGTDAKAFYSPSDNTIYIPPKEKFLTEANFRSTLLHEISHWAIQHQVPANSLSFNPALYGKSMTERSKEEVTVEMAAYVLSGKLGVEHEPVENTAAYVRGWAQETKLKDAARNLINDSQKVVTAIEPFIEKARERTKQRQKEMEFSL